MTDSLSDVLTLWRTNRAALSTALDNGLRIAPEQHALVRAGVDKMRLATSILDWTEAERDALIVELDATDALLDRLSGGAV